MLGLTVKYTFNVIRNLESPSDGKRRTDLFCTMGGRILRDEMEKENK